VIIVFSVNFFGSFDILSRVGVENLADVRVIFSALFSSNWAEGEKFENSGSPRIQIVCYRRNYIIPTSLTTKPFIY